MRSVLAFILTVLLAGVASADPEELFWHSEVIALAGLVPSPDQRRTRVTSLRPGQSAYAESFAATADDSRVLDVSMCTSFTAMYYRSGTSAEAHLIDARVGPAGVVSTAGPKILSESGDVDFDGVSSTGTAFIYNIKGIPWIWVDTTTAPGGTDVGIMRITCAAKN